MVDKGLVFAKIKKLVVVLKRNLQDHFYNHQKTSQILGKPFQAIYHLQIVATKECLASVLDVSDMNRSFGSAPSYGGTVDPGADKIPALLREIFGGKTPIRGVTYLKSITDITF